MGSSSQPSHTTQTTEPPAFIRPFLQHGAQQARALYETGGPQYYPGNTVVPFSSQTEAALGGIEQRAMQGSPVNQAAQNYATGLLSGAPTSQFGSAANPFASSTNPFGSVGNPVANATNPYGSERNPFASSANPYGSFTNPVAGTTNTYGSFENPYASGPNPFGGASNPMLDAAFNQAADRVTQRLQSGFAGSGRNIDAARPVAADELGSLAAGIYLPAYESERNRQLAFGQQQLGIGANAAEAERNRRLQFEQQLTGIGADTAEAERNRQLSFGQQQLGIGAQGFENATNRNLQFQQQLTGLGSDAFEAERARQAQFALSQLGIGGQGYESERDRMAADIERQRSLQLGVAGLAPTLAGQDYVDLQALQGVGGQVEDLAGRLMEDQAARWDFGQNAPQMNLDNYLARITGSYPGGTTTGTTPTYRNRASGALGGALGGAGLASALALSNPWTAALAIGGGLLGAYG